MNVVDGTPAAGGWTVTRAPAAFVVIRLMGAGGAGAGEPVVVALTMGVLATSEVGETLIGGVIDRLGNADAVAVPAAGVDPRPVGAGVTIGWAVTVGAIVPASA
ncbi:MAG: hypothetical protein ACR2PL_24455, partial [Dehalococcoidia bacterium]